MEDYFLKEISADFYEKANDLAKMARWFFHQGYSPATSTNFSCRLNSLNSLTKTSSLIAITRSGIDKEHCSPEDIMPLDLHSGQVLPLTSFSHLKPSAETPLHVALYRHFGDQVGAVLHTHSVRSTVFGHYLWKKNKSQLKFDQLEVLKALSGIHTHEVENFLPIFPNTQDMDQLASDVINYLRVTAETHPQVKIYGVLIAGHGLYAWGKNLTETKRHVEAYEYLMECMYHLIILENNLLMA